MRITADDTPPLDRALALYDAVGWTASTRDPDRPARSLAGSHLLVTAWDDAAQSHPFYRAVGFQAHPDLGLAASGYRP